MYFPPHPSPYEIELLLHRRAINLTPSRSPCTQPNSPNYQLLFSSTDQKPSIMSHLTLSSTLKLNTGYEIPRLGFGVFEIGNDLCAASCLAAFEAGYRHIDSATFYENEEGMGRAIRQSGLKREELFITSKINSLQVDGYESTLRAVDKSLRESGLDYFDLYLVHDGLSGKQRRLDMWRALVEKQKEGKIRTVGVSNFGVHHFKDLQEAGLPLPALNQIELHPYCQQREIVKFCEENGILIEAYSPLIRGKAEPDDAISKVAASKENVDIYQVLVRWSLQKGYIPLPKSQRPEKIRHNADVYNFELSDEEMKAIDALDKGDKGALLWNPTGAA
ncbi:Aldo/keto reductase [Clavulina sp. PMI_390]|nr:Aldo/keto reductase [Clavulina sp. PMI_390]